MAKETPPTESDKEKDPYNQFLISEYLRLGSIDAVFKEHHHQLYVSYPTFARLRQSWYGHGVVEKAGPNTSVSELLHVLAMFADTDMPLESFYRRHVPHFINTNIHTCYRVLQKIKEGTVRRHGTALVITPSDQPESILVGQDISLNDPRLGQPGNFSLPMTYSKKTEKKHLSLRRVLEREVFTQQVIDGSFPYHLLPADPQPFGQIIIADILVNIYHLPLSQQTLKNFSSFKIVDHQLSSLDQLVSSPQKDYRSGLADILKLYSDYLFSTNKATNSSTIPTCQLNRQLAYATSPASSS